MAKNWVGVGVPLLGSWVPIEHKVAWAKAYLHTKWHLSPSSRLATTDIGRKWGAVTDVLFYGRGAGSPSNTKSPEPRPTSVPSGILIHAAVWPRGLGPHLTQSRLG